MVGCRSMWLLVVMVCCRSLLLIVVGCLVFWLVVVSCRLLWLVAVVYRLIAGGCGRFLLIVVDSC